MSDAPARRMSRSLRAATHLVFGLLAVSGAGWLLLHFVLAAPNEFGTRHHPLEALVVTVHGVIALGAIFLCGWLGARHAQDSWKRGARRRGGMALVAALAVVAASGLAQFFVSNEDVQVFSVTAHEIAGALLLPVLLWHRRRTRLPALATATD